jgi:hypothetical protein
MKTTAALIAFLVVVATAGRPFSVTASGAPLHRPAPGARFPGLHASQTEAAATELANDYTGEVNAVLETMKSNMRQIAADEKSGKIGPEHAEALRVAEVHRTAAGLKIVSGFYGAMLEAFNGDDVQKTPGKRDAQASSPAD